ncbi:MAG: hypothetical protein AAGF11_41200 [Myxococcota bacterium]
MPLLITGMTRVEAHQPVHAPRSRIRSRSRLHLLLFTLALILGLPGVSLAGPLENAKEAHSRALRQFTELELDSAIATVELELVHARRAGMIHDPVLAPLLALRGGLIHSMTSDRSRTVAALREAVHAEYHVSLPVEMRTEELEALLDEARAGVPRPRRGPIDHTPPTALDGQDITFEAVSSVPLSKHVAMALWWRKAATNAEFVRATVETFGNLGIGTIPVTQHADVSIEYFFSVSDGGQRLASLGDESAPLTLQRTRNTPPGPTGLPNDPTPLKATTTRWPRLYLNLGIGTGIGISYGSVEQTYQQYLPKDTYGVAEQACAIARWQAGSGELPTSPTRFAESVDPAMVPGGNVEILQDNYDPTECAKRHSVTLGTASAPLHLNPEVMVRIHDRNIGKRRSLAVLIGAFGRLQVVTGSSVFTDDPDEPRDLHTFENQVRSPKPTGTRRKHDFTWAAGGKLQFLIAKRGGKFHGMLGLFGGYGHARLRVNMGFSNDRNGNSVPDEYEKILSDKASAQSCTPVWPYNERCNPGNGDQSLAMAVQRSVPDGDRRIDTVRLGSGFAGILLGFRYQPYKHFGIYGEANIGGWFPNRASLLVDINVGPSITF